MNGRFRRREVVTKSGTFETPLFLPVYQPNDACTIKELKETFKIRGLILNSYFLYKNRLIKGEVLAKGIKDYLPLDGMVMSDSGAFQQLRGPLYLSNKKIIAFQRDIGVDIASPLDLISLPGDNRSTASKKLGTTLKRIRQGMDISGESVLAGVQQGGRFLELRGQSINSLVEMGVTYIALGSLVPFFNRGHRMDFVGQVILQARQICPPEIPLHLYGSGDPLELPFYAALGCDVFDSSSFVHYARQGWLMTPYGSFSNREAFKRAEIAWESPYYQESGEAIWDNEALLIRHNLWTILRVMDQITDSLEDGSLSRHLEYLIEVHQRLFPDSQLRESWYALHEGGE
ncbi:MAG: tRNA-guanine transglycosylase [Candidatus Latescibacterota bacterium]|nr:tRNA-guanine transglycosylase [Candidatus Latescibacterota bacterium]